MASKKPILLAPDRDAAEAWCAERGVAADAAVYLVKVSQLWARDPQKHYELRLPGWEGNPAYTPLLLRTLERWWKGIGQRGARAC